MNGEYEYRIFKSYDEGEGYRDVYIRQSVHPTLADAIKASETDEWERLGLFRWNSYGERLCIIKIKVGDEDPDL